MPDNNQPPKSSDISSPETDKGYKSSPHDTAGMPPGIPYIIGNEAAERFSFYGMRAILAVFLTQHLLGKDGSLAVMDDHASNVWQHNFVAAVYFFPILGSILSDWLLGKYRTILLLSMVYCAGHAVMALVDFPALTQVDPRWVLFAALALIAIGSGGIKPCVSAHVGDQFGPKNKHLLSKIFGWFYFAINFGSTVSTFLTPLLLVKFGPGVAFGVPGVLMAIATFVFWLGRKQFVHIPAGGTKFFAETFSDTGARAILNLLPLYLLITMFWCLFDQTQSAWVHQAKSMDRNVFGWEILPSQLQLANPILVMMFIPIFAYFIYPALGKLFTVTPLRKIGIGLFLMVPSFLIPGWVQMQIDAGDTPHIGWQLLAYVVITAAEIMVSITVLEFSYTQAPKKMKSFVMGVFFLSITLGNLFTAQVNELIVHQKEQGNMMLTGANYYWFFSGAMLLTAIVFAIWSPFYRGQTYIQGDEAETH